MMLIPNSEVDITGDVSSIEDLSTSDAEHKEERRVALFSEAIDIVL